MFGSINRVTTTQRLMTLLYPDDNDRVVSLATEADAISLLYRKGMTKLQSLSLLSTEVTDTGLVHLKGLTKLQRLSLSFTKVTDAGVKKLQAALPKCLISR